VQSLFPFDSSGPYDSYRQLVSRFGVLRLMLAAQCTGDTLPDAATMVHTVQAYCRRFQHDTKFAKQVDQILENTGWATLDKLYGFLRS
jgi:lysine-N-methylase